MHESEWKNPSKTDKTAFFPKLISPVVSDHISLDEILILSGLGMEFKFRGLWDCVLCDRRCEMTAKIIQI